MKKLEFVQMTDIVAKKVEVKVRDDGKVLWVNTEEGCLLRICGIEQIFVSHPTIDRLDTCETMLSSPTLPEGSIPLPGGLYAVPVTAESETRDEHGCVTKAVINGRTVFFGCML